MNYFNNNSAHASTDKREPEEGQLVPWVMGKAADLPRDPALLRSRDGDHKAWVQVSLLSRLCCVFPRKRLLLLSLGFHLRN